MNEATPIRTPPRYDAVKRQILAAIESGRFPPGVALPNEAALAERFGVAIGTIRRATQDLVAQGMLSRQRRHGTIVTGRTPQHSLSTLLHSFRLHDLEGRLQTTASAQIDISRRPATPGEAAALQLPTDAEVIRFVRVRSIDGAPVMHDVFILPAARLPGFPATSAEAPPLLYLFLQERYGLRISAVSERLRAELATPEMAAALGLSCPAAVLVIEEIAYDQANRPTVCATHTATTARHRYINEVQ